MNENIFLRAPQPHPRDSLPLRFLYHTLPGRALLRLLCARPVSDLCGRFLDSPLSKFLIEPFVRKNAIELNEFFSDNFQCFNDCFSRKIRPGLRPVNGDPKILIAPCDGLLTAYPIQKGLVLPVKQSHYSIASLLGGDPLASVFDGGLCLVFRLCVHHYHRYCYPDDGQLLRSFFLPGQLHTVRPIALEQFPVFVRNCRAVSLLETEHLGRMAQIEVGAMLVGKIKNHPLIERQFMRGQEKGMFLYGGSTIILLTEPGKIQLSQELISLNKIGAELPVRMGEAIAHCY